MKKRTLFIAGAILIWAPCAFAQPIHQAQAKMETMQHITERHQAERKALREKQNAERLEIRLMHQKEMESLLQKHKLERRSAIYR
ncbi:MAG: hypothetical protein P8Y20_09325 [Gammaproteobacteria bacterium]|jgi:uncharacterized membrane protein (DUF106 family)